MLEYWVATQLTEMRSNPLFLPLYVVERDDRPAAKGLLDGYLEDEGSDGDDEDGY